jgi:thiol-disulfide isomerase/thioredoxin
MRFLKILVSILVVVTVIFSDDNNLDFKLKDVKDNVYHINSNIDGLNIKELKGKVVFLAFFGHRCPPCMREISHLIKFTNNKKYAKKAQILALEVQGLEGSGLKDFINYRDINYNVIAGSNYSRFLTHIGDRTNWNNTIPFMVVIDDKGKFIGSGNGIIDEDELKSITDRVFKSRVK